MILGDLLHEVEPNLVAALLAVVLTAIPAALFRWMRKHIAEPVQQIPALTQKQQEMGRKQQEMDTKLATAVSDIAAVKEQVHANHGTSLRDSVNRNEVVTRQIAEYVGIDPETLVPPMPPTEREPVR